MHALTPDKQLCGKVTVRTLSCFCSACLQNEPCQNSAFTGVWKAAKVEEKRLPQKRTPRQKTWVVPPQLSVPRVQQTRKQCFHDLHARIEGTQTFRELYQLCLNFKELSKWPIKLEEDALTQDPDVDTQAPWMMPGKVKGLYVPVKIKAAGNCFFRSISFLASGSEENHVEFRVRILSDMTLNAAKYVDFNYLRAACGDNIVAQLAEVPSEAVDTVTPERLQELFQSEVQSIKSLGTTCGAWEMFSAANVLNSTIHSSGYHLWCMGDVFSGQCLELHHALSIPKSWCSNCTGSHEPQVHISP